jgi:hypothetical protein
MRQNPFSELPTEELVKKAKGMKVAIIILGVMVALMFISGGYLYTQKGFTFSTLMPILFLPLWYLNFRNWKMLKDEIAKRG